MLLLVTEEQAVTNEPKMNPELPTSSWESLLSQAARRCDVDPDEFVRNAWAAYLDAHPGMREHLEELQLRAQLEELRKSGSMGQA
jgi:hypothetical protein